MPVIFSPSAQISVFMSRRLWTYSSAVSSGFLSVDISDILFTSSIIESLLQRELSYSVRYLSKPGANIRSFQKTAAFQGGRPSEAPPKPIPNLHPV